MEQISKIIDILLENFDIAYMLCVNVLTYGLIKLIDIINNKKKVKLITKRICLIACTIICFIVYKFTGAIEDSGVLINSTIAAPVFYSWVMKPILNKYKIGYKNE